MAAPTRGEAAAGNRARQGGGARPLLHDDGPGAVGRHGRVPPPVLDPHPHPGRARRPVLHLQRSAGIGDDDQAMRRAGEQGDWDLDLNWLGALPRTHRRDAHQLRRRRRRVMREVGVNLCQARGNSSETPRTCFNPTLLPGRTASILQGILRY